MLSEAHVQVQSQPNRILNLPSHTEVHTSSPIAAGLPVLEIVRKLEEEKILLRDDRGVLKEALYSPDPARREEVIKALCDVELNMQSRFAVRRLKAILHQNNSGEVSSSSKNNKKIQHIPAKMPVYDGKQVVEAAKKVNLLAQYDAPTNKPEPTLASARDKITPRSPEVRDPSPSNQSVKDSPTAVESARNNKVSPTSRSKNSKTPSPPPLRKSAEKNVNNPMVEDAENDKIDVQETISKVVGDCPMYSGNDHFNVLSKIARRLHEVTSKFSIEKLSKIKFAVLIGSGSYNPLTRIHLRTYYLAKQYLETKVGFLVLGSLLSPAHSVTVRERYRTNPLEILPAPHRLAIAQLLVESSQFLSVDPWEMTRRRAMDYLSLLEHCQVRILKILYSSSY
jgi:hypothetical protein